MNKLQTLKITAHRVLWLGLIASLATSCGNYAGGGRGLRVSSSGINYGATADLTGLSGLGTTTDGVYSCPNTANVLSNGDALYSSAGKYTVCTQSSNAANIKIHGQTNGSNGICVFPIQVVDSSHIYFKPDLTTGLPLNSCATVDATSTSNGIAMSFSNIAYNAAFIVDDADQAAMQLCLANGNSGGCPQYSYGKFR